MNIGAFNVSKLNDGIKVETGRFIYGNRVLIKNLETNELLMELEEQEIKPLIKLLEMANTVLKNKKRGGINE